MRWFFLFAFLLLLLSGLSFFLTNEYFPLGIVSFEMPGTVDVAWQGVMQWSERKLLAARVSLWLDFVFIIAYVGLTCWGCDGLIAQAGTLNEPDVKALWFYWARQVRRYAVILIVLAAGFDVLENLALLQSLTRALMPETVALGKAGYLMQSNYFSVYLVAKLCALVKFFILGMALSLVVPVAVGIFRQQRSETGPNPM